MEIKLTFTERILINSILPTEDSYLNLLARKDLLKKIVITNEEVEECDLKNNGSNLVWDEKKAKDISVNISEMEREYISNKLKSLDKEKKLNFNLVSFYKEIMK